MEADRIGLVLARASELRSKINACIDRAASSPSQAGGDSRLLDRRGEADGSDTDDEESDSLFSIRDALETLEEQLGSLQVGCLLKELIFLGFFGGSDYATRIAENVKPALDLLQKQRYFKEVSLSEIDCSRKILLKKLKEYKGEDLEVIREATAFAGETVDHDDDLLLPPYPSRFPDSLILDEGYSSHLPPIHSKPAQNGVPSDTRHETKNGKGEELQKQQTQPAMKNSCAGRLRFVFGLAAKTVFALVSVISVLSLAGFEPKLRKGSLQFKVPELFQKPVAEEARGVGIQCPPGRVMVVEDGKPRCLVKERVEIPFEPIITTPDVSYGCG
ncbi:hypothetical protein ACLOJK_002924 [Asimina triloba]